MVCVNSFTSVGFGQDCVVKDLSVPQNPEAKEHHEDRSPLENTQSTVIEFLVIHWRFLVKVSDAELLNSVLDDEVQKSNGKEKRDSQTIHESDKDYIHDGGILEVHHVVRA